MLRLMTRIQKNLAPLRRISDHIISPLLDLTFRLYLGWAFFKTGIGRAKDYLNGGWDNQLFLFELEHPVPGLSPELAAPLTTVAELTLPILLIAGLMARFGAAGLLVMALIIELTYQQNFQHILWMAMAASVLIKGPGKLSIDYLIVRRLQHSHR